ncbi:hypothetical protein OEV82_11360 [Caldibacillus thermolactis]|jgi:hypothetical protein|uniref:Uncharacterized protein n=1 Tax=Pallidibacillus thermolactis TaxID=251051 RepID=A0ABT2WHA0_9BACI|nr:hypothetical protein [Pallidibacillus thermolactis]MCU9595033.1 hypothetical protein [Pallidibacillus thermolactis]MCU9601393.1 hypothetical protein [Pallidibacillus thermolactis subsp. kokeshiiformis]MED1673525.1 hypothetical protein [Pallidibacillus thermolactis subsp. kokeshiiformis]
MKKLSVRQLLENQGIKIPPHLAEIERRWEGIQSLKQEMNDAKLEDYDLAIRNMPGGDHVE